MLISLFIQNLVVIEKLEISFTTGYYAITGETGSGKSILIDAIGLVTGDRGSASLIRPGKDQAIVSAVFQLPDNYCLRLKLEEEGLANDDNTLVLRRLINSDGRSRAYINDIPVNIKTLQEIGKSLIEIHDQFDQLLEPSAHREFLDIYANLTPQQKEVSQQYHNWKKLSNELHELNNKVLSVQQNVDFLRNMLKDLEQLDMQSGEEELLTQQRTQLLQQTKYQLSIEQMLTILCGANGIENQLYDATRVLEKITSSKDCSFEPLNQALGKAKEEVLEAIALLKEKLHTVHSGRSLEDLENRLFQLRSTARKYSCIVSQLPEKLAQCCEDLAQLDSHASMLENLEKLVIREQNIFLNLATELSIKRKESTHSLNEEILKELSPLKLQHARFETVIDELSPSMWGEHGIDKVQFYISTNPLLNPGPLAAIASGGERSRFMLALKASLANINAASSIIFDEIDQGVGGAVAHAIGHRLLRLSAQKQVIVVTHSPQVAAMAQHHLHIEKSQDQESVITKICLLTPEQRLEEVARMLAGDIITDQARAAAAQLLSTPGV